MSVCTLCFRDSGHFSRAFPIWSSTMLCTRVDAFRASVIFDGGFALSQSLVDVPAHEFILGIGVQIATSNPREARSPPLGNWAKVRNVFYHPRTSNIFAEFRPTVLAFNQIQVGEKPKEQERALLECFGRFPLASTRRRYQNSLREQRIRPTRHGSFFESGGFTVKYRCPPSHILTSPRTGSGGARLSPSPPIRAGLAPKISKTATRESCTGTSRKFTLLPSPRYAVRATMATQTLPSFQIRPRTCETKQDAVNAVPRLIADLERSRGRTTGQR